MVKTPSSQNPESATYFETLKKLKRFKPIEPSLGILGSFFLTVLFFLCFLSYLGYTSLHRGFQFGGKSSIWSGLDGASRVKKIGFLEEGGGGCDLFDGQWIYDETYPLYKENNCRFLDEGFQCIANGRKDKYYTKWRWQPNDCDLPRFDAKTMLEKLRNRRIAFVGDSIGRNQWESLLCMLSSAVTKKKSIFEVNGSPITKHTGFLVFKFKDFNCTIEYYRAPFLVLQSRAPAGVAGKVKTTVKLDQMDWSSAQWRDADVLIFNTGHWWNYEKTIRGGCYFQEGGDVKMDMTVESAYVRSIETLVDWMRREVNMSKTQVFYRTYAPVHFRGGDWRTGGTCDTESLPELGSALVPSGTWDQLRLVDDVLLKNSNRSDLTKLNVLNVTEMASRRKDGHASVYYIGPKTGPAPRNRQDCSHWCLPGVPDSWNELLYSLFLKREAERSHNH